MTADARARALARLALVTASGETTRNFSISADLPGVGPGAPHVPKYATAELCPRLISRPIVSPDTQWSLNLGCDTP